MTRFSIEGSWRAGLLIALLSSSVTCSKAIARTDVVGVYQANHGQGTEVLEVKEDGTYALHFKSSDHTVEHEGSWEFEITDGRVLLTFRRFRFGLPGYGSEPPGMWLVEPTPRGGSVRLVLDDDLGYYYQKQ